MSDRLTIYRRVYTYVKKLHTDLGFTEDKASRVANIFAVKNTNIIFLAEQELGKNTNARYDDLIGDGAFLKE